MPSSPLGDRVRDEAVATAKSWSHPTVERRHVLYALLRVLDEDAPADVPLDVARRLLEPRGTSDAVPAIADDAASSLASIADVATAVALARSLAAELTTSSTPGGGATVAGDVAAEAAPDANGEPSTPAAEETEASILAELDGLIGMAEVKATIRRLLALQHLNEARATADLPVLDPSKHLVFTGDPGTGKTTVARIVARLYRVTGVVSRGHLVEGGRADLVAGYVGQTALKVQDVVRRAIGGVLFIDEAYALATDGFVDFGDEAVATLVQMMEEHRDDLAVIAAGYSDEMRVFIESNPGLRSRFTHYVHFPNYTTDELVAIFGRMAAEAQVGVDAAVLARIAAVVDVASRTADFGNARYVRSLFEGAYGAMAARALADGAIAPTEIHDLAPADIDAAAATIAAGTTIQARPIGFRAR